jgi:tripartite-type tricarboxylate transporter receptor subunit TctC
MVRLHISSFSKVLVVAFAALITLTAQAQSFPNRPITMLLPLAVGSAGDVALRIVAQKMSENIKQTIVIENQPGVAGLMGTERLTRAPADGYLIGGLGDSILNFAANLATNLNFDPVNGVQPIAMVATIPWTLAVNPNVSPKTLTQFIEKAKANPGQLDYASTGTGSASHIGMELLASQAKIKLTHIPYKGAAAALQDVVAGEVSLMIVAVSTALPFIKDGRLVPIAIGSLERLASIANVPTISESGYPGFEAIAWQGVLAPKGTSPALIEKISNDMRKITQSASYKEALILRGTESRTSSALEMSRRIKVEFDKTSSLIKSLNIQLE